MKKIFISAIFAGMVLGSLVTIATDNTSVKPVVQQKTAMSSIKSVYTNTTDKILGYMPEWIKNNPKYTATGAGAIFLGYLMYKCPKIRSWFGISNDSDDSRCTTRTVFTEKNR